MGYGYDKLPWWLRNASIEDKMLYLSGCPRPLWRITEDILPPLMLIESKEHNVRISPKEQQSWIRKVAKSNHVSRPYHILIASTPTDAPGLALLTWWCKKTEGALQLLDLGNLPHQRPDKSVGLFNVTVESTWDRVAKARDTMYRYHDRFVALVVSGVYEPIEYANDVLRYVRFDIAIHLDGDVGA